MADQGYGAAAYPQNTGAAMYGGTTGTSG